MRINPTIHTAYGNSSSTRSTVSVKKTTDTVPEFKLQSQAQEVNVTRKNVAPVKHDLDSILSKFQEDSAISQLNSSIASADEIGVASSNTEGLIIGDASIHYEKVGSIYDISSSELKPRLGEAISESKLLNTEGMTKVEIYNRVQSIFTDYLGKDYLEPSIIYGGGMSTLDSCQNAFPKNTYQSISNDFDSVLRKHGVTQVGDDGCYDPSVIIAAKGYTGMSESETRSAVRNQYPENMTLKNCILMSDELGQLGLETTAYGRAVVENIFTTLGINSGEKANTPSAGIEEKKIFDFMLEMPASFDSIKKSIESNRTPAGNLVFEYDITSSKDEMLKSLLSWFGGSELYGTDMSDKLMELLEGEK